VNLVLDSSALITLARIGRLDLLRQLARGVHIPEAVYEEVLLAGQVRRDVRRDVAQL
jgi:predicted nucleic acid-binding protein